MESCPLVGQNLGGFIIGEGDRISVCSPRIFLEAQLDSNKRTKDVEPVHHLFAP